LISRLPPTLRLVSATEPVVAAARVGVVCLRLLRPVDNACSSRLVSDW